MAIRYHDLDLPDGVCIADGDSVVPWNDGAADRLALNAMLLAQGAKRAEALFEALAGPRIGAVTPTP